MLIESRNLDPTKVSPFDTDKRGFAALSAGNLAVIGAEGAQQSPEIYSGNIADLLLNSPSTAIMHFEEPVNDPYSEYIRGTSIMMAANYHNASSEGYHRIIVQNPSKPEDGQWQLWIPPGSQNKTFHRREETHKNVYPFEEMPVNVGKMDNFFIHVGESDQAIKDFIAAGYEFSEEPLGNWLSADNNSKSVKLHNLSRSNRSRWDPLANK